MFLCQVALNVLEWISNNIKEKGCGFSSKFKKEKCVTCKDYCKVVGLVVAGRVQQPHVQQPSRVYTMQNQRLLVHF
jgi:hypothetical protein